MKKITLILAVLALGLASCKKNYYCLCKYTYPNGAGYSQTAYSLDDMTEKKAESECSAYETTNTACTLNKVEKR